MPRGHWNRPRTCITIRSRPIRRAHPREVPADYPHRNLGHRRQIGEKVLADQMPCYVVHATGSVISIRDGEQIGDARWEGRWLVQCSLHGTKAWYKSSKKAIAAARDASFCRECYLDALRSSPCPMCYAPKRGCFLCEPNK